MFVYVFILLLFRFAVDSNTGEFSQIGNQTGRNLDLTIRVKASQTATLFDTCDVLIELYYLTSTITLVVCPIGTTTSLSVIVTILIAYAFTGTSTGTISTADVSTNQQ